MNKREFAILSFGGLAGCATGRLWKSRTLPVVNGEISAPLPLQGSCIPSTAFGKNIFDHQWLPYLCQISTKSLEIPYQILIVSGVVEGYARASIFIKSNANRDADFEVVLVNALPSTPDFKIEGWLRYEDCNYKRISLNSPKIRDYINKTREALTQTIASEHSFDPGVGLKFTLLDVFLRPGINAVCRTGFVPLEQSINGLEIRLINEAKLLSKWQLILWLSGTSIKTKIDIEGIFRDFELSL